MPPAGARAAVPGLVAMAAVRPPCAGYGNCDRLALPSVGDDGIRMASAFRYVIAALAIFSVWIIMLPLGVLRAFILRDLWSWFLVPLGLPEISVLHAFGLGLFATLFVDQMLAVLIIGEDNKAAVRLFLQGIAGWLATWGLGAVVAYMM